MIATNIMMNSTPPTIPPITGARGNLLPSPFGLPCTRFVEVGGLLDEVEVSSGAEGAKSVVVVGMSNEVEDWRTKGQND